VLRPKLLMIGACDFADLRPKNRQICVHILDLEPEITYSDPLS